jgi:hypothetical protein
LAEFDLLKGSLSNEALYSKSEWFQNLQRTDPPSANRIKELVRAIRNSTLSDLLAMMPINQAMINASTAAGDVFMVYATALAPIYYSYGLVPRAEKKDIEFLCEKKVNSQTTLGELSEMAIQSAKKARKVVFEGIKQSNSLWESLWLQRISDFDDVAIEMMCTQIALHFLAASRRVPSGSEELAKSFNKLMEGDIGNEEKDG